MSEIKAALTAEEWAAYAEGDFHAREGDYAVDIIPAVYPFGAIVIEGVDHVGGVESEMERVIVPEGARPALAAVCLAGLVYGFTQEDVRAIAKVLEECRALNMRRCIDDCSGGDEDLEAAFEVVDSVLHRVSALLPPEEPAT